MRTSFHHQPEAQHPIFQLSTSWQADYPIFRRKADIDDRAAPTASIVDAPRGYEASSALRCGQGCVARRSVRLDPLK